MTLAVLTPLKSASLNNSSRPKPKGSVSIPRSYLPIIVGYSNDREIRGIYWPRRELQFIESKAKGKETRCASEMRRCMSSEMCR